MWEGGPAATRHTHFRTYSAYPCPGPAPLLCCSSGPRSRHGPGRLGGCALTLTWPPLCPAPSARPPLLSCRTSGSTSPWRTHPPPALPSFPAGHPVQPPPGGRVRRGPQALVRARASRLGGRHPLPPGQVRSRLHQGDTGAGVGVLCRGSCRRWAARRLAPACLPRIVILAADLALPPSLPAPLLTACPSPHVAQALGGFGEVPVNAVRHPGRYRRLVLPAIASTVWVLPSRSSRRQHRDLRLRQGCMPPQPSPQASI